MYWPINMPDETSQLQTWYAFESDSTQIECSWNSKWLLKLELIYNIAEYVILMYHNGECEIQLHVKFRIESGDLLQFQLIKVSSTPQCKCIWFPFFSFLSILVFKSAFHSFQLPYYFFPLFIRFRNINYVKLRCTISKMVSTSHQESPSIETQTKTQSSK